MGRILSAFMMFVMIVFFSVPGFAQNQPPKKVYVVFLSDAQGSQFVLQDIEATDFNGVKCIKGTHAGGGWAFNRTIYLPVEKITEIIEEDSLDQYKADTAVSKK